MGKFFCRAVIPVTVNKTPVQQEEILRIAAIVFGWLLLSGIGKG